MRDTDAEGTGRVSAPGAAFDTNFGSLADTLAFAEFLGGRLRIGDLVLLEGGLGAGKTTFVQGLARGMGLTAAAKSPTYTLVHEYRAAAPERPGLGHLDLYRIPPGRDLGDLGLDELLARGAVAVEWGGRLLDSEADALLLTLAVPADDEPLEARRLSIGGQGKRGDELSAAAMAWLLLAPQSE